MEINDSILRHYLRNVYFLNGTAYAGKSTMAAMLAERYDMIHCGENYHHKVASQVVTPQEYPNLGYFQTMESWQAFVNRPPEVYERWIDGNVQEIIAFELAELLRLSGSGGRKIIVDTNLPVEVLHRIAGHHQVAIMLSPLSLSVDRFFDRSDPDKQFLLDQIRQSPDPDRTMRNFRACLARINSRERYEAFANSGFFTLVREDAVTDTREAVLQTLARHFGLEPAA